MLATKTCSTRKRMRRAAAQVDPNFVLVGGRRTAMAHEAMYLRRILIGFWERGTPQKTITADADGHFHVELERNVHYEVRITSSNGELLGYGYPGPSVRSNYLARFLTPSLNALIAD